MSFTLRCFQPDCNFTHSLSFDALQTVIPPSQIDLALTQHAAFETRTRKLNMMLHRIRGVYKDEFSQIYLHERNGTKMVHKQKLYTAELKREAVKLLETSGKSGAVIAQEFGISDGSLYTWRKQLSPQGEEAFPGKGHQTPTEEEFRQHRSENERLRQERDTLLEEDACGAKKTIAIESAPPGQK